jgi:hypothetical protein
VRTTYKGKIPSENLSVWLGMVMGCVNIRYDLPANTHRFTDRIHQLFRSGFDGITLDFIRPTSIVSQASSAACNIDRESMLIGLSFEKSVLSFQTFGRSTIIPSFDGCQSL